jgi:Zn-dependent protease with chaperone function
MSSSDRLCLCAMLLSAAQVLHSQDLVYTKNRTVIECELDTTSLHSAKIGYRRYDQNTRLAIDTGRVLFIRDFAGEVVFPTRVIANKASKLFHWPHANHLPAEDQWIQCTSVRAAIEARFTPCAACMNTEPFITDKILERRIARQANIQFRLENEILYEDSRLPQLQRTLRDVLGKWPEDLKGFDYRVQIYKGEPNALTLGDGSIYFSTGLMNMLESSAEIEAVMAHEIAHAERRHMIRQYYHDQNASFWGSLAALVVGAAGGIATGSEAGARASFDFAATFAVIAVTLVSRGYSRELEQEADIMAQLYLAHNKLQTRDMLAAMDKLSFHALIRGGIIDGSEAYASHPAIVDRINQIQKADVTYLERPIVVAARPLIPSDIEPEFATLEVSLLYNAPTSLEGSEAEVFLLGICRNNTQRHSLKLDDLKIVLKDGDLDVPMEGLDDFVLYRGQQREFAVRATLPRPEAQSLVGHLRSRSNVEVTLGVTLIGVERKGMEKKVVQKELPSVLSIVQ